jgi:hypothetical protein
MDWPGVARYCFDASGHTVRAWPDPGQPLSSIERVHRRAVVPAALQHLGFETLHASAASFRGGVVGFVGAAGAGKSTMARACASAGAGHWADDTLVMRVGVGRSGVQAVAIPFDVALRNPSKQHFGSGVDASVLSAGDGERELAGLMLLDRGGADVRLSVLTPGDALQQLLPHACTFTMRDDSRRRRLAEQYLTLVSEVPVYRLSYPSDFTRLPEAVDVISSEVGGGREGRR